MVTKHIYTTREAWLAGRGNTIGGSDAGSILGMNPWMSNTRLWRIKTGREEYGDLSDNALVQYGINAEPLIRGLFALDYPAMAVWYEENNLFVNDKFPWAHFSADGLLQRGEKKGILEIKTATVSSGLAAAKWKDDHLPPGYFCQILHAMAVMEADFAYLRALLHYPRDGEPDRISIKDYMVTRPEVEEDIKYLMEQEKEFFGYIERDEEPPMKLPEI